jgi:hypothetical protein
MAGTAVAHFQGRGQNEATGRTREAVMIVGMFWLSLMGLGIVLAALDGKDHVSEHASAFERAWLTRSY